MLLPGTACNYQTNFATVLDRLGKKYHLICVNYDGFDGSDAVFPDMITVTERIERYIQEHFSGKLDGALGSSLGSTFVGQLIMRQKVHIDHGIFGSPDLDQSGKSATVSPNAPTRNSPNATTWRTCCPSCATATIWPCRSSTPA